MSRLKLKLLGQMECRLPSGELLNLSTRKSEVLLAYLAMAPNIRHSRDRLVNLLWSDRGEDQARNSLRQSLSSLKKTLDQCLPDLLEIARSTVSLSAEKTEVDVLEFKLLAEETDIENLTRAADLYQGEFLEGMVIRDPVCEQWLSDERDNLKRAYVEVLNNLSRLQLEYLDFSAAIQSAERLVTTDPLEERGWRMLMTAYQQKGNRNHALLAYKRCCEVLQKELGVEPEIETSELQIRIKDGQARSVDNAIATDKAEESETPLQAQVAENSILVLPLQNLSNDSDQQYFSDGLTESIIMGLSLFPSLKVHSRNSSFAAGEQHLSISEIGNKFLVQYVVEGSIRKSRDHLRVSAQLIDTRNGEQVWGSRFDNPLEETFELEDRVTRSIVAAIKGKIETTDSEIAIRKPVQDIQSYDLLLQGYYHLQKYTPSDNRKCLEIFLRCLELEPNNSLTHNRLYQSYIVNWLGGWTAPRNEVIERAGFHVKKALSLAADNALIQADYAEYCMFREEWNEAEIHADRSLLINPNDPEVLSTISAIYAGLGQVDKAIELADTCYALDPFHPWIHWVAGVAYYRGKQYHEALRSFNSMPNPADEINGWIAACHYRLGDKDSATKYLQLYLDICKANMGQFPQTLDEWRQYWSASSSFKSGDDVDYPFDALCDAGLREFVEADAITVSVEKIHNIAVLPFDNLSGDPEQEYFSDGITESIIINLSLFPGLLVKSRNSSFAFKQQIKSLGEISKELNVDYVVEGSIRKSSDRIRITVQLIEAENGNQIWGKRYDAGIENLFDLEEELSRTIAATVTGQIESDLQRIAIAKGAAGQQAYDLLLSGSYRFYRFNRKDNLIATEKLNQCLNQDPDNVRAHVLLYQCHLLDYLERWTQDYRASFKVAAEYIHKALSLGPEIGLVQTMYAQYLVFCGEFDEATKHLDKALAINPNDPDVLITLAFKFELLGEFTQALEASIRTLQLDPYHPWAEWELVISQYLARQYETALQTMARSRTSPGFVLMLSTAANVKLGRIDAARQQLQIFLQECQENMLSMPQTLDEWLAYTRENYPFADPQINRDLINCLVQAGLEDYLIPESDEAIEESDHVSSIAVLPFDNLSGDSEQEYFSDGITDSIIINLSLFPDLSVKSRNSSFAFKQQIKSLGEISSELNVDYVVEGSIRKSSDRIRITVQLVDAQNGDQIWGKRYDSELSNLFDLEEELSRTIAATVTGQIAADLQRIAISKSASDQQSYDLLLSGKYHCYKFTREDMVVAQEKLEACLELDPTNVQAHALLYECHLVNWMERWVVDYEQAFKMARDYIHKALKLDPEAVMVQIYYAEYLIFCKDNEAAARCVEKVLSINPNNPDALATKAFNLNAIGEYELALEVSKNCQQLDPYNPWVDWIVAESQLFTGDPNEAIKTILNAKTIISYLKGLLVIAYSKIGDEARASQAMQQFLQMCRDSMLSMPSNKEEWIRYWSENLPYRDTRLVDDLIECLMKSGLCEESNDGYGAIPSIAVLPFENMSGDPEQEYFSDGITASLIQNLGLYKGLAIKSQQSSFSFKESSRTSEEIAEELKVDFLIEGSIRKSSSKIRIFTQLIESSSGNQVWGKQYDSELEEIFELEQELSQTIAATISGRIGHTLQQSSVRKPAKNLKSYDYLLRGLYHMGKFNAVDMVIAREQVEKCIEIDPENAEAHMQLAMIHALFVYENWSTDRTQSKKFIRLHNAKALTLAPDNALVHAYLAEEYLNFHREYDLVEFHVNKSIELNPTDAYGYAIKAQLMSVMHRYDEALELADLCYQLDPNSVNAGWIAGDVHMSTGNYEKAITIFRSIIHPPASMLARIAACLAGLDKIGQAKTEMNLFLKNAREQMPNCPDTKAEWRIYWAEVGGYKFENDFEDFFALLLRAGLCDE